MLWHGRAGAVEYCGISGGARSSFWLAFCHLAHDPDFEASLCDLSTVIRRKPYWCKLVISGDMNVDFLPELAESGVADSARIWEKRQML